MNSKGKFPVHYRHKKMKLSPTFLKKTQENRPTVKCRGNTRVVTRSQNRSAKTLLVNEAASQTTDVCISAQALSLPARINDLKDKFQIIDNELRDKSIDNKDDLKSVVANLKDITQNILAICSRIENKLNEKKEPDKISNTSNNVTLHSNPRKRAETV